MKLVPLTSLCSLIALGTLSAHADPIYPSPGQPVLSSSIVASATGTLVGTYLGGNAVGSDSVRLIDVTSNTAYAYTLVQSSAMRGDTYQFGQVTAGDVLAFQLINQNLLDPNGYYLTSGGPPNPVISSDNKLSSDGISDTWVTPDANGGVYVNFEDIPRLPDHNYPGFYYTDSDYNDVRFDVDTVAGDSVIAVTPEPGTFLLLGTGLLGAAGAVRRRVR